MQIRPGRCDARYVSGIVDLGAATRIGGDTNVVALACGVGILGGSQPTACTIDARMIRDFIHSEDHQGCLSIRPVGDDDELFHLGEWHYAVGMLARANVPTVAFFVLRHLGELVLKRIISEVTGERAWGHDLRVLLERLPAADPLRSGVDEPEVSIRNLMYAIGALDRGSDAARYAFNSSGLPSFGADVCIQPDMLSELAGMLWDYCLERAGGWHGSVEGPGPHPTDEDHDLLFG